MTYVVYKASDDYYSELKSFETLSELQAWTDTLNHPVIIRHNFWWNEQVDTVAAALEIDEDKAREIANIKYELLIYDDYIE